jgi:ribosomal protein L21E
MSLVSTNASNSAISKFSVGQLVEVASRTWPGINKHGGVGRIVKVTGNCVDVHYVLGGRERSVPIEYVNLLPQSFSARKSLRDRSILLGRCRNCGSLRADCGSCDFQEPQATTTDHSFRRTYNLVAANTPTTDQSESQNSSSDESVLSSVNKWKLRKYGAKVKFDKLQHFIWDSSDDNNCAKDENDSESSENDDQYLKELQSSARVRRNKILLNRLERTTRPKGNDHDKSFKSSFPNDAKYEFHCKNGVSEVTDCKNRDEFKQSKHKSLNESFTIPSIERIVNEDFDATDTSNSSTCEKNDIVSLKEIQSDLSKESQESNRKHQPGILLFENDLDGFIQPEGAATLAPLDREDRTLDIPFAELPQMFDQTLQRVTVSFPDT